MRRCTVESAKMLVKTILKKTVVWYFQLDLFDTLVLFKNIPRKKIDSKQSYEGKTILSINYLQLIAAIRLSLGCPVTRAQG